VSASPNLDLVRSIFAAWERGDYSSTEWADPAIEYVIADGPDPGSRRGHRGMAQGWQDVLRAWEGYRSAAEEYNQIDEERVLVLTRFSARGKRSGVEIGQMWTKAASLYHVCGGRVTRLVLDFDRDHALADLGLAPEVG
jgi:ketosteroid isomerase-like protein